MNPNSKKFWLHLANIAKRHADKCRGTGDLYQAVEMDEAAIGAERIADSMTRHGKWLHSNYPPDAAHMKMMRDARSK